MSTALVSNQNRVETPFIIVTIGDYTFGHCSKEYKKSGQMQNLNIHFPNYINQLSIVKINGSVNTYNLVLDYQITELDDPNKLDKIFGRAAKNRNIKLSYGDWSMPSYIYKEEEGIITNISTNISFENSKISYTLQCTSTSLKLKSVVSNFPAKKAKPSDEIKDLLKRVNTGLQDIFPGMRNMTQVESMNLIASDDKKVQLEAKNSINILDYIAYLVSCMVSLDDDSEDIKQSKYLWSVYDDISNELGGSYFKVIRINPNSKYNITYNTYEVDIGYPSGSQVSSFQIRESNTWSLLYDYSRQVESKDYIYQIDNDGNMKTIYSPTALTSGKQLKITEEDRDWWTKVTQFPITATLVIKGLMRPSMLMQYVKVNSYFYGHKHISSGLYVIIKQEDSINSSGYKTTLTLLRLSGDQEYV